MGFFGGVEQNIADVARGLTARRHQCFLAFGESTGKGVKEYSKAFLTVTPCIDAGATGGVDFRAIMDDCKPDVVYLHKVDDVSPFLTLSGNVRTVRMVHDHDIVCPRRHKYFAVSGTICDKPAGLRCWLDGAFIGRSTAGKLAFTGIAPKLAEMNRNKKLDQLIVGSEFMERSLVMNGFSPETIARIAPAVDETPVAQVPVPSEPILLFVGQLIRGKGVDLLLESIATIDRPLKLIIAGGGNAREQLERQATHLKLNEKVVFRGWVDHQEIGRLYDEARAVVVPSRWPEPFGMVGPEAMRHGRAVTAFDAGGIRDWLRHENTGLLAPAGDTKALGKAIARVLHEPGLAEKFGAAALEAARAFYGFEHQLDQIEAALAGTFGSTSAQEERRTPCGSV